MCVCVCVYILFYYMFYQYFLAQVIQYHTIERYLYYMYAFYPYVLVQVIWHMRTPWHTHHRHVSCKMFYIIVNRNLQEKRWQPHVFFKPSLFASKGHNNRWAFSTMESSVFLPWLSAAAILTKAGAAGVWTSGCSSMSARISILSSEVIQPSITSFLTE